MKAIIYYISIVILTVSIGYGGWLLKRYLNYSLSYEDQVTATVCEMVKSEFLKNPSKCQYLK